MTLSHVALSLALLAGLFEIGGGYLIWRWWRDGGPWAWGAAAGAIILALYGIVPTYQPANFGRVYAAYGGVFVVIPVAWGWAIGGVRPDGFDLVGVLI